MNAPTLEQIALAVLAWQRRNPLAEKLSLDAVHSIGLVALPFLRSGHADDPPTLDQLPRWRQWLKRSRTGGARAAFGQAFIDGISARRAAGFALRHGVEAVEGADDWPQRRIAVDKEGAGWPYELWLATAALEGSRGRQRVLVALRDNGPLAVIGRRALDTRRLAGVAVLALLLLGGLGWGLREEAPPPPDLRVSGAVQAPAASAVVAAPAASAVVAASAAFAASAAPAASPAIASTPLSVSSASMTASPTPPTEASAEPPIDIRPRLNPARDGRPRPPLGGGQSPVASAPATAPPSPAAPAASAAASAPAPQIGSSDPERVSPRQAVGKGPTVALVSPIYPRRAEAEEMLQRMRLHVAATLQAGDRVEGEVFELQGGFRAAVWPFGSREEAQIINATMVARGWKTRAVDF